MGMNILNSVMTLSFNQDLANILTAKEEHFHSIFTFTVVSCWGQSPAAVVSFGLEKMVTTSEPFLSPSSMFLGFLMSPSMGHSRIY